MIELFRQGFEQGNRLIQMDVRHHIHVCFGKVIDPEIRRPGATGQHNGN
jgi:hypothetical protein